ncbi:MAG TPA: mannose-1-phosphate guanylyltransferase [Jatrophihabitantaceae bacterium]|jgi:mannose-1-phosphate guanylyltransferase
MQDDFYAVIPAGGSGTRLWPLSRTHNPKFLHPLTGTDRSLLQATFDRLAPLVTAGRVYVVTGAAHADAVAQQLPELPAANLVVEPSPRDSCAAIALATEVIARRHPDAIIGSFHADHLIDDAAAFARTVALAAEGATGGLLMTIGITPTRPETGYGYVECTEPTSEPTVQKVLAFREKPSLDVATEYIKSGRHLWNSGMFVWRASTFLEQLNSRRPDVAEPVSEIAAAWDGPQRDAVLGRVWDSVPKVAVDYAVMEPASVDGLVGTVHGDFGWSDIGDFETVGTLLGRDESGVTVVGGTSSVGGGSSVVSIDSDDVIVVPSKGRLVALLDVHDVVVVDTPDAVMVCRRERVQDVKKLTELLRERGRDDYV